MTVGKTVAFHTLGCKLNFAETSTLARQFEMHGFRKTDFNSGADVYVINTCSVTEDANRECRRIVRNALRISPDAFVIVTGCYAQLKPHEIAAIKGVDLVLGANTKFNAIQFINGGNKKEKAEIYSCEIENVHDFIRSYSTGDRTRAFLKVQDGCDYNCSYCTIPLARGASRSDSIENIVNDAVKIASHGTKEIVLTGVNVGDFGKEGENFLDLLKALEDIPMNIRFRISSIEPNLLSDEIIELIASARNIVPHFHIPLQSGSNKILGLMRRRYKKELYANRVAKIKSLMPHCCIGADVIVGFPGETEEDFLETYHFINSLNVSYLHVFTYSERENTEAITFNLVVPMEERRKRNKVLRNLSVVKQQQFYAHNTGTKRTVLWEEENKNGFMLGFTENYIKVKTAYNPALVNSFQSVLLCKTDTEGTFLYETENNEALMAHPPL